MIRVKKTWDYVVELSLRRLRWVIVSIGLIAFALLWWFANNNDPSSASGSLLINLAATALTVAFTALLIDWLQERRQRLLVAKPLEAAKHELGSVCFMIGLILGKPYLGQKFFTITAQFINDRELEMDSLARLRKNLINALGELTPETCPATTPALATALTPQITERVASIDEVLRLYGFALEPELRDQVYLLRDRLISLRNSLSVFELGGTQGTDAAAMEKLAAMGIQSLIESVKSMGVEWAQVKEKDQADQP